MVHVAFLRGVNVPGHVVKMPVLKAAFESLRLANVETFIASGNVVFETAAADMSRLERRIEARLRETLGYDVAAYVRSCREVSAVAALTPFPASALTHGAEIYIGFLPAAPGPAERRTLLSHATAIDAFQVAGREVFWLCRKELAGRRSAGPPIERVLGVRATFRNARTISRIAAKYCA